VSSFRAAARLFIPAAAVWSACAGEPVKRNAPESAAAGQGEAPAKPNAPSAPHFAEGNGQIVEAPIPQSPAAAFRILFYSGSVDDPPGKEGLTSLVAQLMVEGGTKTMTYPQILRALYPLAAEIASNTSKEQTVFEGEVHPDQAARFIPILADVLKSPAFSEPDFNRIKQQRINQIEKRLRATDDENFGKEMLNGLLFEAHPYGHFTGGTVEGLKSITLDDVRAHWAKVFGKKRMVIGLGGSYDGSAKEMLADALKDMSDGEPRLAEIPRVAKPTKPEVLIAEKPGKAVAISIGFTIDQRRGTEDFFPLALVQSYFGEHRQFHGVLMQQMREKRGLNYGDYAYVEKFIQEGGSRFPRTNIARRQQHFEIWIRPVDPRDAVFSIRLALFLLSELVNKGLTEKNVEDTKTFLSGYTRLWDLTPSRKLGYALDDHFYGTTSYLDQFRAALATMTAAGVNAAIKRNLVAGPVKIAIVAPDGAALKQALVSGEKSEKRYEAKVEETVLKMDESVVGFPINLTEADVKVVKADEMFVHP
jgi:zinc protease